MVHVHIPIQRIRVTEVFNPISRAHLGSRTPKVFKVCHQPTAYATARAKHVRAGPAPPPAAEPAAGSCYTLPMTVPEEAPLVRTTTKAKQPWTADELCRLPEGWRYEIDEGALVIMSPGGRRHGRLSARITYVLAAFAYEHKLGEVESNEFGFYLHHNPETLRGIDVAFYSTERVKLMGDDDGFPDVPPDLAVEVHLPDERDMQRKVAQYLAAGVRSVWVIDPRQCTLTQHRPGQEPVSIREKDTAVREPVLPGFECRLGELFGEE